MRVELLSCWELPQLEVGTSLYVSHHEFYHKASTQGIKLAKYSCDYGAGEPQEVQNGHQIHRLLIVATLRSTTPAYLREP